MPGDKDDLLADNVVGRGDRLLWIARVVRDNQIKLFAEHPALGVDVGDRHLGAALHLLAKRGIRAGDRPDHRDRDVLRIGDAGTEGKSADATECRSNETFHETSVIVEFDGLYHGRRRRENAPSGSPNDARRRDRRRAPRGWPSSSRPVPLSMIRPVCIT